MPGNKIQRINEDIQRELASLIRSLKDPRIGGLVSITTVRTTGDLRYAKVYISTLDEKDADSVIAGLKSAAGYLRRELGSRLKIRYTPELIFEADDSIRKGSHIISMLNQLDIEDNDE